MIFLTGETRFLATYSGDTYHDNKREAIVKDDSPRGTESLEAFKLGALQDCLQHGFDDEQRIFSDVVISQVEADKRL